MENITLRAIDAMADDLAVDIDMQPDVEALEALDAAEKELCQSCCLSSGLFFMEPWNCPNC